MEIRENVPLSSYTTFHIGGPAENFTIVNSIRELLDAVFYAKEHNIPFFILGTGANILISDKGIKGLVIKNEAKQATIQNNILIAESGAVIEELITMTSIAGLSGFEHFAGIPSTIGGALWQNLHFLSPDRSKTMYIGDIVVSADIFTESGKRETVSKDYFSFGYDTSILHKQKDIVLSATFLLTPKDKAEIQKTVAENLSWREAKHPNEAVWTSAGSVFRKIEGYGAGRLIEQVGLKGYHIGGAKISEKHANFIINTGDATATDVKALIDLVAKKIYDELGLTMQLEISLIGEFT